MKHKPSFAVYMSCKVQTSFEDLIICLKLLPKFPSGLVFGLKDISLATYIQLI